MASTTANYGWPYQDPTDPPDGASLGEDLAVAIDTDVAAIDARVTAAEADIVDLAVLIDQRTTDAAAISSTTLVSVLSVTLPKAGTYTYDALITLTNTTAVGRPGFALGGTSTPTAWRWSSVLTHYNTATGSQATNTSGTTYPASTAGFPLVNSDLTTTTGHSGLHIKGTVTVSAAGTLQFRLSEQAGAGSVNVKAGSIVTVDFVA